MICFFGEHNQKKKIDRHHHSTNKQTNKQTAEADCHHCSIKILIIIVTTFYNTQKKTVTLKFYNDI